MTDKEFAWHILSVPQNIKFIDYRKRYSETWLTMSRKILRVSEMETKHIIACINMLERAGQQNTLSYEGLVQEIRKRTLQNIEK